MSEPEGLTFVERWLLPYLSDERLQYIVANKKKVVAQVEAEIARRSLNRPAAPCGERASSDS